MKSDKIYADMGDTKVLKKHWLTLLQTLDPMPVADILYQNEVLQDTDMLEIYEARTRDSQIRVLHAFIMKQPETWNQFEDAIVGSGQAHLLDMSDSDEHLSHRCILQQHWSQLVVTIDAAKIATLLYSEKILNDHEMEMINEKNSKHDKAQELLMRIQKKPSKGYEKFKGIMKENDPYVYDLLSADDSCRSQDEVTEVLDKLAMSADEVQIQKSETVTKQKRYGGLEDIGGLMRESHELGILPRDENTTNRPIRSFPYEEIHARGQLRKSVKGKCLTLCKKPTEKDSFNETELKTLYKSEVNDAIQPHQTGYTNELDNNLSEPIKQLDIHRTIQKMSSQDHKVYTDTQRQVHQKESIYAREVTSAKRLSFHHRRGDLVILTNGRMTAERQKSDSIYDNGLVMTSRPLEVDHLFQIKLEEISAVGECGSSLRVGVTSHSPTTIDFPAVIADMPSETIYMRGRSIYGSRGIICKKYGYDTLQELECGDIVGLKVTSNGELHFYLRGVDQGVAVNNIGQEVWGVVDVAGKVIKIKIEETDDAYCSNKGGRCRRLDAISH